MTNIKQMRQFYRVYADDRIGQTLSDEFGSNLPTVSGGRKFYLSWSHYLKLMRMKEEGKRHFYEIEAARNGWSAGGYPAPAYEVSYGPDRTKLTLPLVAAGESNGKVQSKAIEGDRRRSNRPRVRTRQQKVRESARKVPESARKVREKCAKSARKRQSGIELRKNADLAPLLRKIG